MKVIIKKEPIKLKDKILSISICLSIGILALTFSIKDIVTPLIKKLTYVETSAEIIDYSINSNGNKTIIVEYQVNRETYTKTFDSHFSTPEDIGTQIIISYNPKNPTKTNLDTNTISNPFFCFIFGTLFIFIGIKIFSLPTKKTNYVQQSNGFFTDDEST